FAARAAGPADGDHPDVARGLESLQYIRRVPAGADADRDIAGTPKGTHLPGEDFREVIIIGDAGELRLIGGEGNGSERMSIATVAADKLRGHVGGIHGAAAVAE